MGTASSSSPHGAWTGLDQLASLLSSAEVEGASLTFAVATHDGERTVARRALAPSDTVKAWVRGLLAEHGGTPGLHRCRLRRWAPGGRPQGGCVLRPVDAGEGPVVKEAPAQHPGPTDDEARRLRAEVVRLREQVAALSGELAAQRARAAEVPRLEHRVAALKAERRALREAVEEHEVRARRSKRRIAELEAENQELNQGVAWINETLGELGL